MDHELVVCHEIAEKCAHHSVSGGNRGGFPLNNDSIFVELSTAVVEEVAAIVGRDARKELRDVDRREVLVAFDEFSDFKASGKLELLGRNDVMLQRSAVECETVVGKFVGTSGSSLEDR